MNASRSRRRLALLACVAVLTFAGCVHVPPGPNVMVMPGRGKTFEAFDYDDQECRAFAASRVAPDTRRANDRAVTGAAAGTAVGAATGAAIGAAAGDPAMGAAVGAGVGLLGGSAVAADETSHGRWSIQQRYDAAYIQCMYACGNRVPVPASSRAAEAYRTPPPPPPPPRNVPPPPRGRPPAPPPGADD
ncbi:MAG: hypothetical protein IT293_04580 [Deltaproteobacteria bacterium]|nr:hypothetical protein [Deltaproteobacteria bacterium]